MSPLMTAESNYVAAAVACQASEQHWYNENIVD
jgi:hypothetical protein